jgi:IS1 family transposase
MSGCTKFNSLFKLTFMLSNQEMRYIVNNMNRLSIAKRTAILGTVVKGISLQTTSRLAGVSVNTVTKLLVHLGSSCSDYHDEHMNNLRLRHIQCEEIWAFRYARDKDIRKDKGSKLSYRDVWTWVAIDAETKLVPSFMIGTRSAQTAREFVDNLVSRLANRVQLTTNGQRVYLKARGHAIVNDIDYAMLVKLYGTFGEAETRYSSAECIAFRGIGITGYADPQHISTSYVKEQNLTMRMQMLRFAGLNNAFSKKVENHFAMLAIHFMHYNFARVHKSLRVTPSMAAGITDHVWSLEEIAKF